MQSELLDDFRDISGWSAVASGQAQLTLASDAGPARAGRAAARLRLQGRRRLRRRAQERLRARCRRRGRSRCASAAPRRRTSSRSSSRPERPQRLVVAPRRVRVPGRLAAAAHPQQRGRVRLGAGGRRDDARARRDRDRDRGRAGRPRHGVDRRPALRGPLARAGRRASLRRALRPGARAASARSTASPATSWRSADAAAPAWLALDFGREHEYGGLVIDWAARRCSRARSRCNARTTAPRGRRSRPRPRPRASAATSTCRAADARGICGCSCTSPPAGGTPHRDPPARCAAVRVLALARRLLPRRRRVRAARTSPALAPPRADVLDTGRRRRRDHRAIMNEEGMVEPDRGSFSLEPFLYADGELVTWADAEVSRLARARHACRSRRRCGAAAISR